MKLEICIDTDNDPKRSAAVAYNGGADTIELCRAMHLDGLTPNPEQVVAARDGFPKHGIVSILRPRADNFCYTSKEIDALQHQIPELRSAGSDGISLGCLKKDGDIDSRATRQLVATCREHNLTTTFHRAFDATRDRVAALDELIELGINRVLTSGTPWGSPGQAIDGLETLVSTVDRAGGHIEVVIAGGISIDTIPTILAALPAERTGISLHAFSGSRVDGRADVQTIQALIAAAHA